MSAFNMASLPAGGVTKDTPKKILLGAGTIHKGLTYGVATAGVFKVTFSGTWAENDRLSFMGTLKVLTSEEANSTSTVAAAFAAALANHAVFTASASGNVVTLTEKSGKEGMAGTQITINKTSQSGTISTTNTTPGVMGGWNFKQTIVGATSGGNKFTITPEIYQPEIDGTAVKIKGLEAKVAEKASLEVGFIELTKDIIKASIIGQDGTFSDENWDLIESKQWMEDTDYWDNVAFVGRTFRGVPIIIILDNALMTSGLEMNPKNKESVNGTFTFECHQEITGNLSKLPYHIYVPSASAEIVIDEL